VNAVRDYKIFIACSYPEKEESWGDQGKCGKIWFGC